MAYKAALPVLKDAWYQLAKNYAVGMGVYKDVVPTGTKGDYILITGDSNIQNEYNNSAYLQSAVIQMEILIKGLVAPNVLVADTQLALINNVAMPTPNSYGITVSGFQITSIKIQSINQLYEDDGQNQVFRYIVRYEHILNQN